MKSYLIILEVMLDDRPLIPEFAKQAANRVGSMESVEGVSIIHAGFKDGDKPVEYIRGATVKDIG